MFNTSFLGELCVLMLIGDCNDFLPFFYYHLN